MELALAQARVAVTLDEVPVGAVVIDSQTGECVAYAHNERESLQSPLAHAEMIALERASKKIGSWRLDQCQMFVTLEPCPMCLGAIQQARIQKLFFGAYDPKGGALSLGFEFHKDVRLNHRFEAEYIPTAESQDLLKSFFKAKRK